MKKSLLLSLALASLLQAESKTELLSSDATLKQSSRQAVMGLSDLGLEAKNFSFPVYYTSAAENAKPQLLGNWKVQVREDYVDNILADNYAFLIPSRFDKLIFNEDLATIDTATQTVNVKMNTKQFSYDIGSLEDFQTKTLDYLNTQIAPKVQKVLSEASDARYKEMPAEEAESFIKQRAKETGMPASVLETLINSSFVFNVYLEKMTGQLNISQVEKINPITGQKYYVFNTSLSAPLNADVTIYEFKNGKFVIRSTVSSEAKSLFGSLAKSISGSSGVETESRPTEADAQKIFDEVFKTSFKDNVIALATRIKEDDAFKVSATLSNVQFSSVELAIGNQEDVRVDHPFSIRRSVDGETKTMGYFKVRSVGDSCLALPAEKRTVSKGAIIMGSAEEADMAYEHPWTGVFVQVNAKYLNSTFNYNDKDTEGGALTAGGLGFNADLGYVLNNPILSEVWMDLDFFGGAGSEGIMAIDGVVDPVKASSFALGGSLGLEKRFYLMSGLFVSGAANVNYGVQSFDLGSDGFSTDSTTLSLSTLSIEPKAKVGYNFTPNVDVTLFAGYDVPLSTSASYKQGDNDPVDIDGYDKNSGLSVGFALNIHSDFAGPFAKMFSKPSVRCNALKNKK